MSLRRPRMTRILPDSSAGTAKVIPFGFENTTYIRQTEISFGKTDLPPDVRKCLAEAFWSHFGANPDNSVLTAWTNFKFFLQFNSEKPSIVSVADLNGDMLRNYIEWLNAKTKPDGSQWRKGSRSSAFSIIRALLQWTERCRPGILPKIDYPLNPFPWRNRDTPAMKRISAARLREIIRACEQEIDELRARRAQALILQSEDGLEVGSLGWLLKTINEERGGVLPARVRVVGAGSTPLLKSLSKHGGLPEVEPLLYPRSDSLLPYYLLILIHAAGNPEPIATLGRDCVQSIPLLPARKTLVWSKGRAQSMQRRTFDSGNPFEPPALVRDLLEWNQRLVPHATTENQSYLFLYKSGLGINRLACGCIKNLVKSFCKRHNLERFSLATLRPSVLTSFYRVSGDLRSVKNIANHAHLSTTVRYVDSPETRVQNQTRIADLQHAFVGHIEQGPGESGFQEALILKTMHGPAVSMFGFDCKDPFAGTAPGSHRGKLCAQFMGCFTCPNAVIPSDPATLARLVQARDHFRSSMANIHPARWDALYAPQLQILELDILSRFSKVELTNASMLAEQLPLLPELR